jgi:NTP pyrophosphatase (non-canonical NTP hydrolase)
MNEMSITSWVHLCHNAALKAGWWDNPREEGTLIALMHSELSEAMEAVRKDMMDDHLPQYKGVGVELADCVIRIFDYCGKNKIPLELIMQDKMKYNARRADHKPENRIKQGGKSF